MRWYAHLHTVEHQHSVGRQRVLGRIVPACGGVVKIRLYLGGPTCRRSAAVSRPAGCARAWGDGAAFDARGGCPICTAAWKPAASCGRGTTHTTSPGCATSAPPALRSRVQYLRAEEDIAPPPGRREVAAGRAPVLAQRVRVGAEDKRRQRRHAARARLSVDLQHVTSGPLRGVGGGGGCAPRVCLGVHLLQQRKGGVDADEAAAHHAARKARVAKRPVPATSSIGRCLGAAHSHRSSAARSCCVQRRRRLLDGGGAAGERRAERVAARRELGAPLRMT